MQGKWIAGMILGTAALAGAAMYYLQVYHFYDRLDPAQVDIALTGLASGQPEPIPVTDVQAIDAWSSPIRYRACFSTTASLAMLSETFEPYGRADPLTAPGWFGCFDAAAIGQALEEGRALAFLGRANVTYGIDEVVVVGADGRGHVWHQINICGKTVFNGDPAPEGCPPPPEKE